MSKVLDHLPTVEEAAMAKLCSRELSGVLSAKGESQQVTITDAKGATHQVQLPTAALNLLLEVLTELGNGNSVRITPIHAELTTQEGADLLNMSRPTFIKLLDQKEIPYKRTGNRRKIAYTDVVAYKQRLGQQRLASLDQLSALDQELDLGY